MGPVLGKDTNMLQEIQLGLISFIVLRIGSHVMRGRTTIYTQTLCQRVLFTIMNGGMKKAKAKPVETISTGLMVV